jgi:DNA-binding transcriptional ArsR family regulator
MLEQLFGSKTRTQLLRVFLQNPETDFFVRELTRRIGGHINAVRHELVNLEKLELVAVVRPPGEKGTQKKHYRLNRDSVLYPELKALFLKSRSLVEKDMVEKIRACGEFKYFALTGHFLGQEDVPTDIFLVGTADRRKLAAVIKEYEASLGNVINYTILDEAEMRYRMDVMDRFTYAVLDGQKLVFIDELFGLAGLQKDSAA